jgi:hypothetical protein
MADLQNHPGDMDRCDRENCCDGKGGSRGRMACASKDWAGFVKSWRIDRATVGGGRKSQVK